MESDHYSNQSIRWLARSTGILLIQQDFQAVGFSAIDCAAQARVFTTSAFHQQQGVSRSGCGESPPAAFSRRSEARRTGPSTRHLFARYSLAGSRFAHPAGIFVTVSRGTVYGGYKQQPEFFRCLLEGLVCFLTADPMWTTARRQVVPLYVVSR